MTNITLAPPIVGQKNTTEEPKVGTAFKTVEEYLNLVNPAAGVGGANIIAASIKESNLEVPLQEKISALITGLKVKTVTESTVAATGEFIISGKNAITITLPAATANREVAVFSNVAETKVKTAAGFFKGDFLTTEPAEVVLLKNQHITVSADGTNWYIRAGEPKRAQIYVSKSWTKAEAETGVTPSTERPAFVTLTVISEVEKAVNAQLKVGGVTAGEVGAATITGAASKTSLGLWVNPGQAWKLTAGATGLGSILTGTVLL